MATTISDRWNGLKNQLTILPALLRRFHRIVAAVWVLSVAVTLAVPAAGEQLPGPSTPGLSFIALIITVEAASFTFKPIVYHFEQPGCDFIIDTRKMTDNGRYRDS